MKKVKKFLLWFVGVVGILIIGAVVFVFIRGNRTFDAPTPEVSISTDSAVIARGKYLAFGPAHCSVCHVPMDKILDVENGEFIPLSGGWELDIPPGKFRAPNLTPHKETGIGEISDGLIARAMRYSVAHDGKLLGPFMPFQELSVDDLNAIISFLRSQPEVEHEVERTKHSFLGKAVVAFGMLKPEGPEFEPPKSVTKEATATYGKYLSESVANCVGCHTERDLKTGKLIGDPYAGGMLFEPDNFSQGWAFQAPNITTDPATGIMTGWTEEQFIARFKQGRVLERSPMPWGAFSRMDSTDLKALYAFLMDLEPVNNTVEKTVFMPGDELP